ncbi:Hsp70 protein that interacts with Zuo1p [Marasmius sp. AFHP31]|nr:Hsp70 protein that interacts with Zuo1p [Marasmius sp. AFHP31]
MSVANGNADPSIPPASASHIIPHVIGINFGNTSIVSITDEDSKRQIASAVSFHGEQIYIGNEALHQLVKNPKNTITGFRNLLGKNACRLDEITNPPSGFAPSGYVLTAPPHFITAQREELRAAAQDAGKNPETGEVQTKLRQLLDELSAVVAVTTSEAWSAVEALNDDDSSAKGKLKVDWTQLVIDVGSSSTSVHLLGIRSGLAHAIGSKTRTDLGGDSIDALLVAHFTKEFNKKSGTTLPAPPKSTDNLDDKTTMLAHRAHAKLLLALPHLKRTLAASNAGTLSVESLHEGIDFTSSTT